MEWSKGKAESGPSPDYGAVENGGENYAPPFVAEPFVPRRGLRNGHMQTLVSHFLSRSDSLPAGERVMILVEQDVQVLCICHWQPDRQAAPALIIIHGLEGSSDSQYVIGTANKAWAAGMSVVRMNVRNCGGTEKLAATLYHSGMSADIDAVLRYFIERDRLTTVSLLGFSMGGNQVLKLAGEWGNEHPAEVQSVAAVSPAMDLAISADALHAKHNRLYEWRFLLSLYRRMRRKARLFPDKIKIERWWWRSLREFDDLVTAPHCGFTGAHDYYERASSSRVLDRITLPTLILHAQDDPFIRVADSTREKIAANRSITFVETAHGGHCGFLADARGYDGRWAEREVVRFFAERRSPRRHGAHGEDRGSG